MPAASAVALVDTMGGAPPQQSAQLQHRLAESWQCVVRTLGAKSPRKNLISHIDASLSRQPLVKGERLVRYEVNAVMVYFRAPCNLGARKSAHQLFQRKAPATQPCSSQGSLPNNVGSKHCICNLIAGFGEYSAARALRTKGTREAYVAHAPWQISSTRFSNAFLFAVEVLAFGWPPRAFQAFKRPTRPTTASE